MYCHKCITALSLVCLVVAVGCRNSTRHYHLHGRLLAKDQATARVTVASDDIPGFMPAMTMSYTVQDPPGLQQAQPGD